MFTGVIINKPKHLPTDISRMYLVWYNQESKWFDVYDENKNLVPMLKDVTLSDNWQDNLECRVLDCVFHVNAILVTDRPVK